MLRYLADSRERPHLREAVGVGHHVQVDLGRARHAISVGPAPLLSKGDDAELDALCEQDRIHGEHGAISPSADQPH